jgi:hypothetical protein
MNQLIKGAGIRTSRHMRAILHNQGRTGEIYGPEPSAENCPICPQMASTSPPPAEQVSQHEDPALGN